MSEAGRSGANAARSIAEACRAVLLTADPREKAMAARAVARAWHSGRLAHVFDVAMPDRPPRPDKTELLPPNRMPKRGRAGSERARIAMDLGILAPVMDALLEERARTGLHLHALRGVGGGGWRDCHDLGHGVSMGLAD